MTTVPFVNVLSLGQGYTVMDGKKGFMDEPVCGIVVPTIGLCFCPILLAIQVPPSCMKRCLQIHENTYQLSMILIACLCGFR